MPAVSLYDPTTGNPVNITSGSDGIYRISTESSGTTQIVDKSGNSLSVSQSQIINTNEQSGFLVAGFDGNNVRFFKTTSDGVMVVTGTFSTVSTNNSIGGNSQNIPSSSSLVGGSDGTFLKPFKVTSDGTLFITGSISATSGTQDVRVIETTVTQSITGIIAINNFPITQSVKIDQSILLPVSISNFPLTQVITGTVLSLPFGTQVITGTIHLDNSLLPVSVSNLPATQTITGTVSVNSFPITQSVKLVDIGTNVTQSITGSVSVNNLTFVSGSNLSVFITASNTLPITGTVLSLPFGTQTVTGTLAITMAAGGYGGQIEGRAADGNPVSGNPVLVGGEDGSTARSILVDSLGRIVTAPAGSSTSVTASLATGYVTTAATTQTSIRATAYTEQTSNAQRSIVSANANDTAAGTGARTVLLVYYDKDYAGPYTETITLNGTVAVNTTNSNICFIEQIYVVTVGSGGANAGIISLRTTTGGGGSTFASIAVGDNRTFYAHHYVPRGLTSFITGLSTGHNGTTVGSGCVFTIKTRASGSNSVERQVSDFVRLYGQSSTNTRNWGTAIKVSGSTRITVYGTPETSTSTIYRAAMDLYDQ